MHNKNVIQKISEHYFLNIKLGIYYLDLSRQLNDFGMLNLSKYIRNLSDDKLITHKNIIFDYFLSIGEPIDGNVTPVEFKTFKTPFEIIKNVYEIENQIRVSINEIALEISKNHDYETLNFWQWFIKDGLKDFNEIEDILKLFELSKDLLLIDQKVGEFSK